MSGNISDNKKIANNTLILYFRMAITMIVSLYTSRVVLSALGVEDYGIYNVVGGVVALLNVISGSMTTATSRFLSYELAQGDTNRLSDTFSTLLNVHILIGIVVLVLGEFLGMWFIENKLNIPLDRINAAIWVLQFSLFTFFLTVINVPYSSSVVSHEEMGVFAYIAIFEVIAKLLIAFVLMYTSFDRLIVYAFLLALVHVIIQILYYIYCRKYNECRFRFIFDLPLFKNILSFIGWAFLGNASVVIKTQGITLLLNMFFGPVVNAAQGVANQVESIATRFVYSYMIASNPQIIKLYSANEQNMMHNLIFRTSKFSAFLLLFLMSPVLLNIDFLLRLWLQDVPNHTSVFVILTVVYTFVDTLTAPLVTGVLSTAKIKWYEVQITFSYLMMVVIVYFSFKFGCPPKTALIVSVLCKVFILFILLYHARKLFGLPIIKYIKKVILPVCLAATSPVIVYFVIMLISLPQILILVISCILVWILLISMIWILGLDTTEKSFLKNTLDNRILKRSTANE